MDTITITLSVDDAQDLHWHLGERPNNEKWSTRAQNALTLALGENDVMTHDEMGTMPDGIH